MPSKFQICSQASVLVGGSPISAFDQSSPEAIIAEALYEDVLLDLLASYRWRFASQVSELNRDASFTGNSWFEARYQLPSDWTCLYGVRINGNSIEFDLQGDQIYCDAEATDVVEGLIGFRPSEGDFPPYFVTALRFYLASLFAVPIAEDPAKGQYYESKFVRHFAQSRSIESQGRTASKLPVGGLRRYHGGRP